jgi:hypothetical protein
MREKNDLGITEAKNHSLELLLIQSYKAGSLQAQDRAQVFSLQIQNILNTQQIASELTKIFFKNLI